MLNSVLLKTANSIMANTAPAQFVITARFMSSDSGSKFSFYPFKINSIVINRDYLVNFADEIDMTMTVSPKDYALMQDQGQNLLCVLTISYVDKFGKVVFTPAPIQTQYNVLIADARDIRKAVPDVQVYTQPSTPITVRLIEPTVYALRHTKLNGVFPNLTMTQAVHAFTSMFGIEKVHLVPPDNTHTYDHILIPSYQGIESIYGFLHSQWGLYQKGANAYLTGGCLFVYPPFETNPVYDKTAMFYQVDTGNFAGNHVFHKNDTNSVSIVISSQPHSFDLSIAGSENVGTGFVFSRASRMTDGNTTIDSQKGAQFTDQPALTVTLPTARTAIQGRNNLFHVKGTDNPFPSMSKIFAHQASLMEVQWMHADPFQIDPGHKVIYYYDENETMVQKTGIVEKATFHISPMQRMDVKEMFGAVGQLTLRLSPNETKVL